jgi:hypothetical protein
MVLRHPGPQKAAIIDEKMMQVSQAPPADLTEVIRKKGYTLSAVDRVPGTLRVLMPEGSVVVMPMDEYLKGVVPKEVSPYWPPEALRAQAVAARSYASTRHAHGDEGADVCTTTHCQVWSPLHYETTDQAVDDTHGVAATFEGSIIYAFFFGHCDGHTRNSEQVWGGYLPYCRSVSCPCGYSSMFGHGVGMCQQGARTLAEMGYAYEDILEHYYTGVEVQAQLPGRISSAAVTPRQGDTDTQFTYTASYASQTGELPAVANVIIDGRAQSLYRMPGDREATWEYRLVTSLPAGEHTYRFYFADGYGHIFSVPNLGVFGGPLVETADPSAPTPTPVPTPAKGVAAYDVTYSTVEDWAAGSAMGTEIVHDGGDGALALAPGHDEGVYTSSVITVPFPFLALGAAWHGEVVAPEDISLEVQRSSDGNDWSAWESLPVTEHGTGRHHFFNSELLFGLARFLRYRVRLDKGAEGDGPLLKDLHLVCIDSRDGPSSTDTLSESSLTGEPPPVISREAWGAEEALMTWPAEQRTPRAVILHHMGNEAEGVDAAAMVRAIYYYQAAVCGWGDIIYNYLVDPAGNVYEGRAGGIGAVGDHAGRYSWGSVGIMLLGDYAESETPEPMRHGLTEFLAWRCVEHLIHPLGEQVFIDAVLPTIMAHSDCADRSCPGEAASAGLPAIRSGVLAAMADVPPKIRLIAPIEDDRVHAVVAPDLQASAVITRMDYYVDDILRARDTEEPFSWRWNTVEEAEGKHRLRIVAHNAAGQDEASVRVTVDNTPSGGSVFVPDWNRSMQIPFTFSDVDAAAMQLSNDWIWEGEDLCHAGGTGRVINDTQALNGQAWFGEGGVDLPGGWYGPYTCALPSWQDYEVCFRLKTSDNATTEGLATLDVVDDQGNRRYDERGLLGTDFARSDSYEDFCLRLDYGSTWPTCQRAGSDDGLEFRTWFSGLGDLYLDRVAVFSQLQPVPSSMVWDVREVEGTQKVIVRFLDEAGNAYDQVVEVNVDMSVPQWLSYASHSAVVEDGVSGLDADSATWSVSHDGGDTWGDWQRLSLTVSSGITDPVQLTAPSDPGGHLRFRIQDVAGNVSESAPLTPMPSVTPSVTSSPTATQEPTLPPETVAPTRPVLETCAVPLILKRAGE